MAKKRYSDPPKFQPSNSSSMKPALSRLFDSCTGYPRTYFRDRHMPKRPMDDKIFANTRKVIYLSKKLSCQEASGIKDQGSTRTSAQERDTHQFHVPQQNVSKRFHFRLKEYFFDDSVLSWSPEMNSWPLKKGLINAIITKSKTLQWTLVSAHKFSPVHDLGKKSTSYGSKSKQPPLQAANFAIIEGFDHLSSEIFLGNTMLLRKPETVRPYLFNQLDRYTQYTHATLSSNAIDSRITCLASFIENILSSDDIEEHLPILI